jgi:hypothetical protein
MLMMMLGLAGEVAVGVEAATSESSVTVARVFESESESSCGIWGMMYMSVSLETLEIIVAGLDELHIEETRWDWA